MKKAISTFLQFLLFFVVFGVGSILGGLFDPTHLRWFVTHPTLTSTRYFKADGLLLAFAVYVLVILIEAARKRISTAAPWTTLAFLLALVIGFLSKFGFATHDLF
ncbi:hypothetical protein [Granulicella tundricola]|uniref:Uncharacterized protein n=1 Tax=Granulicella tundricola (strain ATCC BAA-1859 / DSM 23138 / MP5ACTX9) TaxID=1198114 RepID=E8WWQ1_GRATM|nr:hypothetical protein [Granulicella tundricola]ADW67379.1 hypothetical protein AciX9_0307 [Granulicella tundricola MP5ACTX9]